MTRQSLVCSLEELALGAGYADTSGKLVPSKAAAFH
jgi:hypothetical protein